MESKPSRGGTVSLVAAPAVITLGITLLRLVGELNRWSPRLFSRDAGGAAALVGIVWLVPVFGVYFAVKLIRSGAGPVSNARAVGFVVLAVAVFMGLGAAIDAMALGGLANVLLFNLMAVSMAVLASRGWPALAQTLFFYGLAARVPVAIVALVAMYARWGTHYELGPPGLPAMGTFATWLAIGLAPQMFFWIAFTIIVGGLFGSLAALAVRPR
jgi:hypothetical protein